MFKANNPQLPHSIQELFQFNRKLRLGGTCLFNKPPIRTIAKLQCITTNVLLHPIYHYIKTKKNLV